MKIMEEDLSEKVAFLLRENMELRKEVIDMKKLWRNYEGMLRNRKVNKGHILHNLGEEVTAIVGLREAITSKNLIIKGIWIILLLLGIGATVYDMYEIGSEYFSYPTATRVKFEQRPTYDFPPLAFCTDGGNWLDAEKVLSNGLSMDALSYSLGYFDDFDDLTVENPGKSRQDFMDYYKSHGFTSLLDYYRHIAIDPMVVESVADFPNRSASFYLCNNCQSKNVTKEFVDFGICYVNTPFSAFPQTSGVSNLRMMAVVLENRTRNLVSFSGGWSVQICHSFNYLSPRCRSVTVQSSFFSTIQMIVSEYSSLDSPSSPCLERSEEEYWPDKCWSRCRNALFKSVAGCEMVWLASARKPRSPQEFCNFFDILPGNKSLGDLVREADQLPRYFDESIQNNKSCYAKCAFPCKRTAYQLSLDATYNLMDGDLWGLGKYAVLYPNTSVILVKVMHSAAFDGGVAVWTEVKTFSLSQFVGNIGGTLGLFVGGTVLTLAQIILFGINYLIERNEREE